jgi:hypothetical protein
MLAAASRRVLRLSAARRQRCLLVRADLRSFACRPRFVLAVAAFHSVQHLYTTTDLQRFLRATRACLVSGGWLAFDVLPPDPAWIGRDPLRRWGRTVFHHPVSGQRLVYTNYHRFDPRKRVLHMRLCYQPLDEHGRLAGPERVVRLCHRQLEPSLVKGLLARTGFRLRRLRRQARRPRAGPGRRAYLRGRSALAGAMLPHRSSGCGSTRPSSPPEFLDGKLLTKFGSWLPCGWF